MIEVTREWKHAAKVIFPFPPGGVLLVTETYLGLFETGHFAHSLAAWCDAEQLLPGRAHIHASSFPTDLAALIAGVLDGLPPYGLLDYLLENGPDNLRAELEPRMAAAFN